MLVVSNTSPIVNLAAIGQLDVLRQLFSMIIIPERVYEEIVIEGAEQPGAVEVQTEIWFETRTVTNTALVANLLQRYPKLQLGEVEAIVLTYEINADRLLLDEGRGRALAEDLGLPITGVLGVLLNAKRRGLIALVKPIVDDLINIAGFWIDKRLYAEVLKQAGE
jgi:predicted nucleic acid-binding protein